MPQGFSLLEHLKYLNPELFNSKLITQEKINDFTKKIRETETFIKGVYSKESLEKVLFEFRDYLFLINISKDLIEKYEDAIIECIENNQCF